MEQVSKKFVGMDVHRDAICVAVMDESGRVLMESVIATHASAVVDLLQGLQGRVEVTFEEGSQAHWLYDLVVGRVSRVVVCNPRRNALLKQGNKGDKIDARKLAELLRLGALAPVYHGENSPRTLRELVVSYNHLTQDTTRVKARIKALYRSHAIVCGGKKPFGRRHREEWLQQVSQVGLRVRAQRLYEELDALHGLRRQAKLAVLQESRKLPATEILSSIPFIGPVRAAILLARVQVPNRFRTKRQLWAYCGLALETRTSAEYRVIKGSVQRSKKPILIRGLNVNHNHDLKNVFKGAATTASCQSGPLRDFYDRIVAKGIRPDMARLTLARKLAAIVLVLWKKGEKFDPKYLTAQAA